jgi:BirA family biotin operon repressor/biotin-[acetyl-CoA-carboxylase] ligase
MFDLGPFDHERHAVLDSTNSEALRRVSQGGIKRPTILSAVQQTAGRGSRQREWFSHSGNVHATFMIPVIEQRRETFLVVYPLALATSKTIRDMSGLGARVTLKWPNDVLVDGRKVSGSLHEVGWHEGKATLIAGIGINMTWAPAAADVMFPPAALTDFVIEIPPAETAIEMLASTIRSELDLWIREGFDRVRQRYHAEAFLLHESITLRERTEGATNRSGIYRGIDEDGALVLESETGWSKHYAVDIFPTLSTLAGD